MKLDTEFVRLPLRVDHQRLASEVERIPEAAWRAHPQHFAGNSALPLIAAEGDPNSDEVAGPMRPTPHLATCPYLTQVLSALGVVAGRTRLMRLDGNAEATSHIDTNYYWFDRTRVHVPIVTHPDVTFQCGSRSLHMGAGEVWIFDTWRSHRVVNPRDTRRIHLVCDTVGSASFWSMVDAGDRIFAPDRAQPAPDSAIVFDAAAFPLLECESWNWPVVLAPASLEAILRQVRESLESGDVLAAEAERSFAAFTRQWRGLWARYGDSSEAAPHFVAARSQFLEKLEAELGALTMNNGYSAARALQTLLPRPTDSSAPADARFTSPRAPRTPAPEKDAPFFEHPVFIVCPPRSGSSLLFETLAQSPDLWTIGGESHQIIEGIPELHPEHCGYDSNRLTEADADPAIASQLQAALFRQLRDRDGALPGSARGLSLLEKTPKNALRVPFLARAFPGACFVYLYRDPRESLSSMLDAWRSERFVTYRDLPGWTGLAWSMLLTPGWRDLVGRELPEIVARQWAVATQTLLADLEALSPDAWCVASYDRLVADPRAEIARICEFAGLRWDRELETPLPMSRTTLSSPDPEKWRRNSSELESMLPMVNEVATHARQLFANPPATRPLARRLPAARSGGHSKQAEQQIDFRSSYTTTFPQLLNQLGATLVVTTYQSGRLVLVRANGEELNTHLRAFSSPMGVALAEGRLALGTQREIWEFFDMPALCTRLSGPVRHDAVYIPRSCAVTGDVRVHEMAYAGGELWFVNTRFSSLCTLDREHSFLPRWRPPFISAVTPDDRCHLNGLCVVDSSIRYVTALGMTDTEGGWRANKVAGGCVLELPEGRPIATELCMPHSPRWHDGELWVLESGKGEIGRVDFQAKRVRPIAALDGFTRGLAFAGAYAFVGLSQVRESKVFGGIPLLERVKSPRCGVWVLDTRTGKSVGFLRFEGSVQEIFDVKILPTARYAELIEPGSELLSATYALPQDVLREVPEQFRSRPTKRAGRL